MSPSHVFPPNDSVESIPIIYKKKKVKVSLKTLLAFTTVCSKMQKEDAGIKNKEGTVTNWHNFLNDKFYILAQTFLPPCLPGTVALADLAFSRHTRFTVFNLLTFLPLYVLPFANIQHEFYTLSCLVDGSDR